MLLYLVISVFPLICLLHPKSISALKLFKKGYINDSTDHFFMETTELETAKILNLVYDLLDDLISKTTNVKYNCPC